MATPAQSGRPAIERGEHGLIYFEMLFARRLSRFDILFEATPLFIGVRQFYIAVGQFEVSAENFKAVGDSTIVRTNSRQCRLIGRVVLNDR